MTADAELTPLPARGRRYTQTRRVGLGDVDPSGSIRLDALAGYLQDIASADAEDAVLGDVYAWVVRRLLIVRPEGRGWPRLGERLTLTTFCGGYGPCWAERRTSLAGAEGGAAECVSLWVAIDGSGRPMRLSARFHEIYGEAAGGRVVSARLRHGDPPGDGREQEWPLRRSDLDTLGHVNNAAHWQAFGEVLAGRDVSAAEVEHRDALEWPGPAVLHVVERAGEICVWLSAAGRVRSSARLRLG